VALAVGEVMRLWAQFVTAEPQAPPLEALQALGDADVAHLPIGRPYGPLVGLLSREQVIHCLRLRPVQPGWVSSGQPPRNPRGVVRWHGMGTPAPVRQPSANSVAREMRD
jgi:hypothetical protein